MDEFPEAQERQPIVVTVNEVPEIEDGMYAATVTGVDAFTGKDFETGEPKPQWAWHFAVDDKGGIVELPGYTSASVHPKSTAYAWLISLLGASRMNQPNVVVDFDHDVAGLRCQVQVEHNTKGAPKVKAVLPPAKG